MSNVTKSLVCTLLAQIQYRDLPLIRLFFNIQQEAYLFKIYNMVKNAPMKTNDNQGTCIFHNRGSFLTDVRINLLAFHPAEHA